MRSNYNYWRLFKPTENYDGQIGVSPQVGVKSNKSLKPVNYFLMLSCVTTNQTLDPIDPIPDSMCILQSRCRNSVYLTGQFGSIALIKMLQYLKLLDKIEKHLYTKHQFWGGSKCRFLRV